MRPVLLGREGQSHDVWGVRRRALYDRVTWRPELGDDGVVLYAATKHGHHGAPGASIDGRVRIDAVPVARLVAVRVSGAVHVPPIVGRRRAESENHAA
jgi:hypothetical protein